MLLGFMDELFEVGSWKKGEFFITAEIWQRSIMLKWHFMLVYGLAHHSRTGDFLEELVREVGTCATPLVFGGDFNLIRRMEDKSNDNVNWPRVRRFNDAIVALSLRELNRVGARFTWMNRQRAPIHFVLDTVFVSPSWE
jgi:hypothetical protein